MQEIQAVLPPQLEVNPATAEDIIKYHLTFNTMCSEVFNCPLRRSLTDESKAELDEFLSQVLTEQGMRVIKEGVSDCQPICPIYFQRADKRSDHVMKKIVSSVLKTIYSSFVQRHSINLCRHSKKYTTRKEINNQIFVEYFKRPPEADEAQQIFMVKNGITEKWLFAASGSEKPDGTFLSHVLELLRSDSLFANYALKVKSMLRRRFRLMDEGHEDADDDNVPANKSDKLPSSRTQFHTGIKLVLEKILQFGNKRNIFAS